MLSLYEFKADMGEEEAREVLENFEVFYKKIENLKVNYIQEDYYSITKTFYNHINRDTIETKFYNEAKGYDECRYFIKRDKDFKNFVFTKWKTYEQQYLSENHGYQNKINLIIKIKKLKSII